MKDVREDEKLKNTASAADTGSMCTAAGCNCAAVDRDIAAG